MSLKTRKLGKLLGQIAISAMLMSSTAAFADSLRVIAFGDSITSGLFRTAGGGFWRCPINGVTSNSPISCTGGGRTNIGGYAPRLSTLLRDISGSNGIVYNWGVGAERTYNMVNRINSVMSATPADFVAIMGGANDAYSGFSSSTVEFNIRTMVDAVRARGFEPVVATITPNLSNGQLSAFVQSYNSRIRSLATDQEVRLADQYNALISNFSALTSGDFLHLNESGNSRMAETWVANMRPGGNNGAAAVGAALLLLLD